MQTSLGVLKDAAPVSYQRIGASASRWSCHKQTGDGGYGFAVGAYDHATSAHHRPWTRLLHLPWRNGFRSRPQHRSARWQGLRDGGNSSANFLTTQGAFDCSLNGGADAFVTKLPTG